MKRLAILLVPAILTVGSAAFADDGGGGWFNGQRGFSFKGSAGAAYRQVYAVPIGAADLGIAFGSQTATGGWYGTINLLVGATGHGLFTHQTSFGASWEAPIDKLHIGIKTRTSFISIKKATSDGTMTDLGIGFALFGSYDLVAANNFALFTALEGGVDFYSGDSRERPSLFGGTLGIGIRTF